MKRIAMNVIVLLVAVFCMIPAVSSQTADEMKAVLQGIHDAHNAHDMDAYLSYFTDDSVFEGKYITGTVLDREEHWRLFEDLFHANPDNHVDDGLVLISGNILIQEHNMIGTGENAFRDLPPSGQTYTWPHVDVLEFEGSKVKKYTTYADYSIHMIMSGLMPAPEPLVLEPSFTLPDPVPSGLTPVEAVIETDALWNSQDMNSYAKYFASDASMFITSLGVPMTREEYIAAQDIYILAFPNKKMETVRRLDCGDGWIVSETVFAGSNDGPFIGIPPTGNPFEIGGINLTHVNEQGLITVLHNYYDNMLLLAQLGLLPSPSHAENWELYQ